MALYPAYLPHQRLVTSARETADLPRLVIGYIAIEFVFSSALQIIDSALLSLPKSFSEGFYQGNTTAGLLAQLLSFGLLAAAVFLVGKVLNQRAPSQIIGPKPELLRGLKLSLIACLVVFAGIELLPPYWSLDGAVNTGFGRWLLLLPLTLIALTVQTASEEIFYRGYIQQQVAARFASPLVWLIVPNLLFALAHWNNGTGFNDATAYVIWAFFFGLAASDLTARTGTLGPAIGFHLANNIYAFVFFAEQGSGDSGLSLYLFPAALDLLPPSASEGPILSLTLATEMLSLLLMWLAVRVVLRR